MDIFNLLFSDMSKDYLALCEDSLSAEFHIRPQCSQQYYLKQSTILVDNNICKSANILKKVIKYVAKTWNKAAEKT